MPTGGREFGHQPNKRGLAITSYDTAAPRPGSIQSIWNLCWDITTNHYADFSGTATRREFWTFFLARVIVCAVSTIIPPVFVIVLFGTVIPILAVGTRRLHETNRSGWWQLLQLVPLIGWIILIIMLAQPAKVAS